MGKVVKEFSSSKKHEFNVKCPLCEKDVGFMLENSQLDANFRNGLAAFTLEPHGNPSHTLTIYIDNTMKIVEVFPFLVDKDTATNKLNGLQYNHLVDGTCDISIEEGRKQGLQIIPCAISINGKTDQKYLTDITPNQVYQYLKNGHKVQIGNIGSKEFLEAFKKFENDKPVIVNTINSQISKNHSNAEKAKQLLENDDPKKAANINIIDSCAIGSVQKIMVQNAIEMDKMNYELHDILRFIHWLKKSHRTYVLATSVDSLKGSMFLGRYASYFGSKSSNKPILSCNIDNNGRIEPYKSVKTEKEGIAEIGRLLRKDYGKREIYGVIFHGMNEISAHRLLEYLNIMYDIDKKNFAIELACSLLGINAGLGVIGLSVFPKIK